VLRVVEVGHAAVQDRGRWEARRWGVPVSGALDAESLELLNALVGNPPGAAAVEVLVGPLVVEATEPVVVAAPWSAMALAAGERLRVDAELLAVAGGVAVPEVLGSRSGEALRVGDLLPVGPATGVALRLPVPPVWPDGPIRVVAGPDVGAAALCGPAWRVGTASDRMGLRLDGPAIEGGEVTSDGVVPGAVQVPPSGQPILLLAEAPTTGGYRKPAVVATVDLPRAGRLRPGDEVRFEAVTVDEAIALLAARRSVLDQVVASAVSAPDPRTLLSSNLVSGAVDPTDDGGA
jgi:allophanate hydrolase